jgi:hypothetical protein
LFPHTARRYGKTYDLSIVKREFPGMRPYVSLNIMWSHLEQRSFPLSERSYMEKLEGIGYFLDAWGETKKVRKFLSEPARAQKGLPSKPTVGTSVVIQLELSEAMYQEWFGGKN